MILDHIKQLKHLAREHELNVIVQPEGHVTVVGGIHPVTWWPDSKRMTAYAEGAKRGVRYASARKVIQMALGQD